MTGRVKVWNKSGFGFIDDLAGFDLDQVPRGRDVFVHYTELPTPAGGGPRNLRVGDRVEFDIEVDERGAKAKNVLVI